MKRSRILVGLRSGLRSKHNYFVLVVKTANSFSDQIHMTLTRFQICLQSLMKSAGHRHIRDSREGTSLRVLYHIFTGLKGNKLLHGS